MTIFYLRFTLADNGCSGLMDYFFGVFFFIVFAISILLAYKATFSKRQAYDKKPEPITLTITLLTLAVLIIGRVFGEDFKGSKWIYAKNNQTFSSATLTLRKNGTFRVDISGADVGCYFSGHYQNQGDTILLDKNVIEQTHSTLATKYFLIDSLLIPVVDTSIKNDKFDTLYIADRLSGVQQAVLHKRGRPANNQH